MATTQFDYTYWYRIQSNKKLADIGPTQNRFPKLQKAINLLEGVPSRGGTFALYPEASASGATLASGYVSFTGALSHGAGASNAAFTFIAGSAGACTVTVGAHTGLTITGSGTAATDATALAAVIQAALGTDFTVTANAGDVRIVATNYGAYDFTTTVTADGGAKLSAAAATLTGGTPAGSLGSLSIGGHSVTLGSVPASTTVGTSVATVAATLEAAVKASAAASLLVDAVGSVVSNNPRVTLTASGIPPSIAEVGNSLALTATVGSASGATLSGGVNATDNTSTY